MNNIKVWDLPIRVFHWLLPLLLGLSWYSAEVSAMDWHLYSGCSILGLIVFRVCWGLWGSQTARFSNFIKSPAAVFLYLRTPKKQRTPSVGHSPLAGWSTVILLLTLAVQVISGLFAVDVDGIESGSLSHRVSFDFGRQIAEWHEDSFNVLVVLIALHLLAIGWYELIRNERLVLPMILGRKQLSADKLSTAGLVRFLLAVGVSSLLVYSVAIGFRW